MDEYVGSSRCAECHAEAHQKWEESHHYHAMELPGPETVRADFNNTEFINYGVTTKFFMEGDKFMVETNNQKGEMEVFEIAYTFGWEPLQQFLVKFPDGRMQVLPTCWDVEKENGIICTRMKKLHLTIRFFGHDLCKIGTICVQIAIQRIYERSLITLLKLFPHHIRK